MINFNWIFCLFFILFSFSFSQNENKKLDGVVAMVGDEVLFFSELQENIMQYKSQAKSNFSDSVLAKQVLEELLFQKLLIYHAKIDSIEVI